MKLKIKTAYIIPSVTIVLLLVISSLFFFRIDLTSDKRHSLSRPTKNLLKSLDAPLEITVYLDGDLNPGFTRLKRATAEMLNELSVHAKKEIIVKFVNPSAASSHEERNENYRRLESRGLTPTAVYERDKEGKAIQKIIYPWMEITYKNKTQAINLLKNIRGNRSEENLNISIENLEFEISDGIRIVATTKVNKIAFLEGHGELSEAETYDISKSLSRYFQIDRGVLGSDATILSEYKVIIIAKPTLPFSESDKFIIDQYIMNGGKVLWVVDGVRIAYENLSGSGLSPAMELDLNLGDLFFRYGIRLQPVILQDMQCASIPINIAPAGEQPQFEPSPWYFAPLLLTSTLHPITKNITEVRAEFASAIEVIGENKELSAELLLATSDNTHLITTPSTIDLGEVPPAGDKSYFNRGYVPVAVITDGVFESAFANRMTPREISNHFPIQKKSRRTKQIFVADGDIIRNETNGIASDSTTLPLGYDRYMNQQFGNKEFIQNAVLFLADNDGWMELRSRSLKLRLLNKQIISQHRLMWQLMNILIPLFLLLTAGLLYHFFRKRKYTR